MTGNVIRRVFDAEGFLRLAQELNDSFAVARSASGPMESQERPSKVVRVPRIKAPRERRQTGLRKTKSDPARGTFAWRIKNARGQMGMTQAKLAEAAGVDRCLITSWELQYQLTHTFEDVLKVAEALDVSLEYMAGITDEFGCFPASAVEEMRSEEK